MSNRIFLYRLKTILRDKDMVFWTLAFPIILATLFRIAFANLGQVQQMLPIPTALVQIQATAPATGTDVAPAIMAAGLIELIETMAHTDSPVLEVYQVSLEEAQTLLSEGKVYGYILAGEQLELVVRQSGIQQSIIRIFLDQYLQTFATVQTILGQNSQILDQLMEELNQRISFVQQQPMGRNSLNELFIFYFALLAMACFYGGYFGLMEAMDVQANLSPRGVRVNLSPVPKLKAFLASASGSLVVHLGSQTLLLAFMHWVLGVRFGEQLPLVLMATFIGSVLSIAIGALVGVAIPGNENLKSGVITGITMTGALLAGLMFPQIKQIVGENLPFLHWINPVNLLADGYFSLYYFYDLGRFWQNMTILMAMTGLCILLVYLLIRRRSYASL
jgi:ABC-2 type transport system permease protein